MTEQLPDPPTTQRVIAREMAAGFGLVSLIAILLIALLLGLMSQVSGLVMGMRDEENAIRQGLELATAVREQYIHVAHAMIENDSTHLSHFAQWQERVSSGTKQLERYVPPEERWRINALQERTRELAQQVTSASHAQLIASNADISRIAEEASAQADAIARAVEGRMAHSHVRATEATRLGLVSGIGGTLLIVLLSVAFTVRLRAAVIKPLATLTTAARRFGAGDFAARVGAVGRGELQSLAEAFDRMAEELAEREERLVRNERMAAIGHLAAGVAHELNNPIGIIRGYLKTMSAKDDPATRAEELQILDEEAAQCQRIAEDLLAYARPQHLRTESLSMASFLHETLRRLQESPSAKNAQLELAIEDGRIEADPVRLRQVVLNLVLNAIQVSPNPARITVVGRGVDGGGYEFDVIDDGPGIPAEEHGKIFEPFYSKRGGGSGLGLSVCQGIVRAHGGTIRVESHEGGGARFRVKLLRAPEISTDTSQEAA